jgi:hypothetical protein
MEDIGFVHYWYLRDYRAAAAAFRKASDMPGAPWWLRSLAATTLVQGGDREASRRLWLAIFESAEIEWLRGDARRRLVQLDALDQIDQLQRLVDAFAKREAQQVTDWAPLVSSRVVRSIPVDPTGTPYEITSEGIVQMAMSSPLWPLPQEPERLPQKPPQEPERFPQKPHS